MSMPQRAAAFVITLLGCGVSPTEGQSVDLVGEVVRVHFADDGLAEGVVGAWTPDSLRLALMDAFSIWNPDRDDISIIELHWAEVTEVLRHRSRTRWVDGVLAGALLGGAGAGTYAEFARESEPEERIGTIAIAAFISAALGSVVGATVGDFMRTVWWEPVAIPASSRNPRSLLARSRLAHAKATGVRPYQ